MLRQVVEAAEREGRDWLTWDEVARALSRGVRTVQQWVARGQVPSPAYLGCQARFPLSWPADVLAEGVRLPLTYSVVCHPLREQMRRRALHTQASKAKQAALKAQEEAARAFKRSQNGPAKRKAVKK